MAIQYSTPVTVTPTSWNAGLADSPTNGASSAFQTQSETTNVVDSFIMVQTTLGATGITASPTTGVNVFVYGSNTSTQWPDSDLTGTDAAVTNATPTAGNGLRFAAYIPFTKNTGGVSYRSQPISLASLFGGVAPKYWAVLIQNRTGQPLATSGNFFTEVDVSYT